MWNLNEIHVLNKQFDMWNAIPGPIGAQDDPKYQNLMSKSISLINIAGIIICYFVLQIRQPRLYGGRPRAVTV